MYADSRFIIDKALAKAFRSRLHLSVSEWSDANIVLSTKESPEPGPWRTIRSPLLREPMDCMSSRSTVRQMVLMWPIQFGKTMVLRHGIGYAMSETPGPVMLCLPSEVARDKVVDQKLNPMLDSTDCIKEILVTGNSRDSANRRFFKDFHGGQLFIEHAGAPGRLKSASVKYVFVDELTDFANALNSGDDPIQMLEGRMSAFPSNSRIVYISTPGVEGQCRTTQLFNLSDKRRFHVPCPHCLTEQPLVWSGLHWDKTGNAWYVCNDCACVIDERQKTDIIEAGRWIPENKESQIRGYAANCLYYPIGLGPRWQTLAKMWLDSQDSPATLKTFINDRLAEPFEDPTMRQLKLNIIAERAEPYALRVAPRGVCAVTAGVDTQDNRLEVHITGWGKGMASWTLDYNVIWGDPADDATWLALTEYLNQPIEREDGHILHVLATAIDMGGHRTEAVKDFVRRRLIKRPMAIFGAVANNAPILGRPKAQDINWRGRTDKNGVHVYQVGTVGIKHKLFGILSVDSNKPYEGRMIHFSEQLPPEYFAGIVSETYDPRANRFIKKRGARNEPLDTWVYSYAAAHHPELRLHLLSAARWAELGANPMSGKPPQTITEQQAAAETKPKAEDKKTNSFASETWGSRL